MATNVLVLPVYNRRTGEGPTIGQLQSNVRHIDAHKQSPTRRYQRCAGKCRFCGTPLENQLCPVCDPHAA